MKGNRCLTMLDKTLFEYRTLLSTLSEHKDALIAETMIWRTRAGLVERGIYAQIATYTKSIYKGDTILQFIATLTQHTLIYKRLRKILNDLHDELNFAASTIEILRKSQPRFAIDMFRAISSNGQTTYKMAGAFKEWYLICYSSFKEECFGLNIYCEGLAEIRSDITSIQDDIKLSYESVPLLFNRKNAYWTYPDESYPSKLDLLVKNIRGLEKKTRNCHELWLKTQDSLGEILEMMDRVLTQNSDELDDNPDGDDIALRDVVIEIVNHDEPINVQEFINPLFTDINNAVDSTVGSSESNTTDSLDSQSSEESDYL